jgi:hypothetical protein
MVRLKQFFDNNVGKPSPVAIVLINYFSGNIKCTRRIIPVC